MALYEKGFDADTLVPAMSKDICHYCYKEAVKKAVEDNKQVTKADIVKQLEGTLAKKKLRVLRIPHAGENIIICEEHMKKMLGLDNAKESK